MIIISGKTLYGRIDTVPGVGHIATLFWHLFAVPLIPLTSYAVREKSENLKSLRPSFPPGVHWQVDFAGVETSLSVRSVLTAWLRAALTIGTFVLFVYAVGAVSRFVETDPRKPASVDRLLLMSAGAFACVALLRLSGRWTRANVARARELATLLGMDPGEAENVALTRPPMPRSTEKLRLVPPGCAVLAIVLGLSVGGTVLLPMPQWW